MRGLRTELRIHAFMPVVLLPLLFVTSQHECAKRVFAYSGGNVPFRSLSDRNNLVRLSPTAAAKKTLSRI